MLRIWEEHAPFLGRTGSVFEKKWAPCWEKHAPFLGRTGSVFGKKQAPSLGQSGSVLVKTGAVWGNWLARFWIGLGQGSSFTVLNAKHVWVWI